MFLIIRRVISRRSTPILQKRFISRTPKMASVTQPILQAVKNTIAENFGGARYFSRPFLVMLLSDRRKPQSCSTRAPILSRETCPRSLPKSGFGHRRKRGHWLWHHSHPSKPQHFQALRPCRGQKGHGQPQGSSHPRHGLRNSEQNHLPAM